MFKQRFVTASVLALLFICALVFSSTATFVSCIMLVVLIAGWEWSNLARIESTVGRLSFLLALLVSMLLIASFAGIYNENNFALSYQICFL
jgi:phosphatidate cytidylyltransferase